MDIWMVVDVLDFLLDFCVLDTSFGNAGTAITIIDDLSGANHIHALKLQVDGAVVIDNNVAQPTVDGD